VREGATVGGEDAVPGWERAPRRVGAPGGGGHRTRRGRHARGPWWGEGAGPGMGKGNAHVAVGGGGHCAWDGMRGRAAEWVRGAGVDEDEGGGVRITAAATPSWSESFRVRVRPDGMDAR